MNLGPIAAGAWTWTTAQIAVDPATCETSAAGIFAIGDITSYPGKLKLILCGFSRGRHGGARDPRPGPPGRGRCTGSTRPPRACPVRPDGRRPAAPLPPAAARRRIRQVTVVPLVQAPRSSSTQPPCSSIRLLHQRQAQGRRRPGGSAARARTCRRRGRAPRRDRRCRCRPPTAGLRSASRRGHGDAAALGRELEAFDSRLKSACLSRRSSAITAPTSSGQSRADRCRGCGRARGQGVIAVSSSRMSTGASRAAGSRPRWWPGRGCR